MTPRVSIVIPTYNRAQDLCRALNSVRAQTYACWEALVIDNHSNDDTDNVVESFNDRRIKLYKIHNDGIIAASRNLGIKHARGEYIAFLDSDDWWMPQKLDESLKYLEDGADIVYHSLLVATKPKQKFFWKKDRAFQLRSPIFLDLIAHGNALKNSSVVARKRILNKIGGLSEEYGLIAIEDYDAWLRAARITEKFKMLPKALGYYSSGAVGSTTNPERTIRCLDAFEKRYALDIKQLENSDNFYWINYSKGRAYYLLRFYAMAAKHLRKIHWHSAPFFVTMKTIWMILIAQTIPNSGATHDK